MESATKSPDAVVRPCPFCGAQPVRKVVGDILSVTCPQCVSVGFRNHVRLGCQADAKWDERHLADRVKQLEDALSELLYTAQCCDGWESFPERAIEAARSVLDEDQRGE